MNKAENEIRNGDVNDKTRLETTTKPGKPARYAMQLQRFKDTGKFYDEMTFETESKWMYEIIEEVRAARGEGKLTGEFIYQLAGEGHPDGFPRLVL